MGNTARRLSLQLRRAMTTMSTRVPALGDHLDAPCRRPGMRTSRTRNLLRRRPRPSATGVTVSPHGSAPGHVEDLRTAVASVPGRLQHAATSLAH